MSKVSLYFSCNGFPTILCRLKLAQALAKIVQNSWPFIVQIFRQLQAFYLLQDLLVFLENSAADKIILVGK